MLDSLDRVDQTFRALADVTRRRIVERLSERPATVAELTRSSELTLAAVLQHVQVLERCGLVATTKVGRSRTCRLDRAGLDVVERWIADRRRLWDQRLDRLGDLLGED